MKEAKKVVKKAVIPAAGMGTRFFPATKTIPKEMLPIVDQPTILYVIEEAVSAGIEDIIIIQGRGKTAIEDFFDISYELETKLIADGKEDMLKKINYIRNHTNIISIRQKSALGLGHAVRCAEPIVGQEPFAVLLGDEITVSKEQSLNPSYFLCQKYKEHQSSSVWVLPIQENETHKYGIVDFGKDKKTDSASMAQGLRVHGVIEKPSSALAPSLWALPGRYIFNASIFKYIDKTVPGYNGEIQLSDAMNLMVKEESLYAYDISARRYDAGDKLGYLIANIELALDRPELKDELTKYLKNKF